MAAIRYLEYLINHFFLYLWLTEPLQIRVSIEYLKFYRDTSKLDTFHVLLLS